MFSPYVCYWSPLSGFPLNHLCNGAIYNSCIVPFPALLKSSGLRSDGRIDDISFWINYVSSLPIPGVIPLVYPRMIAIHDLDEKVCNLPIYAIILFFFRTLACLTS